MNITYSISKTLPSEAKYIRQKVFVDEQGFVEEFDEDDNKAIHVVMYIDGLAIGTTRIIFSDLHNMFVIGRVAILKEYRKKGLGRLLMGKTEEVLINEYGHNLIGVSSQERVSGFYHSLGYEYTSEKYLDQDCPHVFMNKQL